MRKIILLLLCFTFSIAFAHTIKYEKLTLKTWALNTPNTVIQGSFFMFKNGQVFIELADDKIVHYPLSAFSQTDQDFVRKRYQRIKQLNTPVITTKTNWQLLAPLFNTTFWIWLLALALLFGYIFKVAGRPQLKLVLPAILVLTATLLYGFANKAYNALLTTTDPSFIDSAFAPFKPGIATRWDNNYFYVESFGLVEHEMMKGITAWQQQVPLPQCYVGSNAWSIPLNPVNAAVPVPVNNQHFLRGAVAIAANGQPIFNPYTNTGVDAYLDGQLDDFGGHCGRADDYHYHIAPLFLDTVNTDVLPIAFALDGYAVYASHEPDGSPMQPLDANHGHSGSNGVYHYHGTTNAPYMIGNMVGAVTEDTTLQIIPQARAQPVRPFLQPLQGAVITGCQPNSNNNGYTLTYTVNGQTDSIVYYWSTGNPFTFNFYTTGNGVPSTQTYSHYTPCYLTNAINDITITDKQLFIFPNPVNNNFQLGFNDPSLLNNIQAVTIYSLKGDVIYHNKSYSGVINLPNTPAGTYLLKVQLNNAIATQKLIVQ